MAEETGDLERLLRRIREVERRASEYVKDESRDTARDLRESVEKLLEPSWSHEGYLRPLYTVSDKGDYYEILVDLPRADEGSIEVKFSRNVIYVRARLKEETVFGRWSGRGGEVKFYEYMEAIPLLTDVDPGRTKVEIKHGVVRIRVYK